MEEIFLDPFWLDYENYLLALSLKFLLVITGFGEDEEFILI
jgi:hypothetical protein